MVDPLSNVLNTADKAMDFADDSFESREEAEATRTQRQQLDMTSTFKLPQIIRPIMAIWAMAIYTIVMIYGIAVEAVSGLEAVGGTTAILMTIIGFYFNSRKMEKVVAKKAETAIQLEEMREKAQIRQDRKEARQERRLERKEQKNGDN